MSGVACLRRAYFEVHSPELAVAPSVGEVERMRSGQEVGRLARGLFEGVLIERPSTDMEHAAIDTRREMDSGAPALFEAAFVTDRCEARVDVLERLPDGRWHVIEVKSSKGVKPEHLWDVAFQRVALEEAGVDVARASLLTISDDYVWQGGPVEPREFFELHDVTGDVGALLDEVRGLIRGQIEALETGEAPEVVPNVHCKRGGVCAFYGVCWQGLPEHDVTTLPLIRAELVNELHEVGVRDIARIPTTTKLSARQRLIAQVVQTGIPFVSEELAGILACLEYPLHFLDFEATHGALPEYPGIAPYRHVPFQWSLHVLESPGAGVRHFEYLHREATDPRSAFTSSLWEAVSGACTLVYYSAYERSRLKELAFDEVPCAALALQAIEERGLDLERLVKEHVYFREFKGRTSIKAVYPALVPSGGYRDLAIQDGDTAAAEYRRMISPATTEVEARRTAESLLRYCERDTQAMVDVFLALESLSRAPSRP